MLQRYKSTTPRASRTTSISIGLVVAVLLMFVADLAAQAQVYQFTLNQRRRADQLWVEVWCRSLSPNAPPLGEATLRITYNASVLNLADFNLATNDPDNTDSIRFDVANLSNVSQTNARVPIVSQFDAGSNAAYQSLAVGTSTPGVAELQVRRSVIPGTGVVPVTTGRGSFVGKIVFSIPTSGLADTNTTFVSWSTVPIGSVVYSYADTLQSNGNVQFLSPAPFTIRGITILNPNGPSEVVDRDGVYFTELVGGYPIYFERSGFASSHAGIGGAGQYVSASLAYEVQYRLGPGGSWNTIASINETGQTATPGTPLDQLADVAGPGTWDGFLTQTGQTPTFTQPPVLASYRNPMRVVWSINPNFPNRSESAQLRIRFRPGLAAPVQNVGDTSDTGFSLGRLFFAQLDGQTNYFKSQDNYLNATQLTVEAWVNLNEDKGAGNDVGIVASGLGPSTQEGAWMLYLRDGRFPSFRAREILGRSNGYVGTVSAARPLTVVNAASPLTDAHAQNWQHIAATVADNIITLYVNGEIVDRSVNNDVNNIRMLLTNHPIWIGANPNGDSLASATFLNAGIKGVRIWRTVLNQTQLRQRVAGIPDPTGAVAPLTATDVRRALEMQYTFEGTGLDGAFDTFYQNGSQALFYFFQNNIANVRYRPDQPHLRLTSPVGGEGVSNRAGIDYPVRWVGYGLGSVTGDGTPNNTRDIAIEFSRDGSTNWTLAKSPNGSTLASNLGLISNAAEGVVVDVESTEAIWRPINNNGTNPGSGFSGSALNLADLGPGTYSTRAFLRIRGLEVNSQGNLSTISDSFTVAPWFALKKDSSSFARIPEGSEMNINGDVAMIEAWIRPYRFPSGTDIYPILAKIDDSATTFHYTFGLTSEGRLRFEVRDANGQVRTALSDSTKPIIRPRTLADDSTWTHVAVYLNRANQQSEVTFFIDGNAQTDTSVTFQLGQNLRLDSTNSLPTYIGYRPGQTRQGFVGEMRELRYWNNAPNGATNLAALRTHVQRALVENSETLPTNASANLVVSFPMNGGSWVSNNGANLRFDHTIAREPNTQGFFRAEWLGADWRMVASRPFIKIAEPQFNERISNQRTEYRLRWVGFNYLGASIIEGNAINRSSLEFSTGGGGGSTAQPFQPVTSLNYSPTYNSPGLLLSGTATGTNFDSYTGRKYAGIFNLSIADPDADNDGIFAEPGPPAEPAPLSSVNTNARLRLTAGFTFSTPARFDTVRGVSTVFTVTPASNFTVRALLEGYHAGIEVANASPSPGTSSAFRAIGTSFNTGGIKIKLYSDNGGAPGTLVDSAESVEGYLSNAFTASAIAGSVRSNIGDGPRFANIPFVFTNIPDGNYFLVVQHRNHLPVMSRIPATFAFSGDNFNTYQLESGWDFTWWDGGANTVSSLANSPNNSTLGAHAGRFAAGGPFSNDPLNQNYGITGLAYNEGRDGNGIAANRISALVAGDINQDMFIDANDRVIVRSEAGAVLNLRSDVDGSGVVDAADRTLVDGNTGRSSSLRTIIPSLMEVNRDESSGLIASEQGRRLFEQMSLSVLPAASVAPVALPAKGESKMAAQAISFTVEAEPRIAGQFVELPMYITNTGDTFGLANATFTVAFNPEVLRFQDLTGTAQVIFRGSENGYQGITYAPIPGSVEFPANHNLRSIEILYDAVSKLPGVNVPSTKTYLGTLRFAIRRSDRAIAFKWDNISVFSTTRQDITPFGNFPPIRPLLTYTAAVTTPNGGERTAPNRNLSVRWSGTSTAPVHVEYSIDNGQSWTRITVDPVVLNSSRLTWQVPGVNSDRCLVRLVDAETSVEVDRSDKTFTIAPIFANITRPSSVDPVYRSGRAEQIRWVADGIQTVRFEFKDMNRPSMDWLPVVQTTDAARGTIGWSIPGNVNTTRAVIRMIEIATGEEATRSGEFKILSGSLTFSSPREGDVTRARTTARTTWSFTPAVNLADIQFSADGGSSWTTLISNVAVSRRSADFSVPDIMTNQAVLRAIYPGTPELEYDRTQLFRITGASSINEGKELAGSHLSEISPNPPDQGVARLTLTLTEPRLVEAYIINALGERMLTIQTPRVNESGPSTLEFPTTELSPGLYSVVLNVGTGSVSRSFLIAR